jgi:hypothetical protein
MVVYRSLVPWSFAFALAIGSGSALGQAAAVSAGAGGSTDGALHAVHSALFASFLPVDELPNDPATTGLLQAARDGMWQEAGGSAGFQQLLRPFADLRGFPAACGLSAALPGDGGTSFTSLLPPQREHVLFLLQRCPDNPTRRLAVTVRNFYIVKGYGAVQGSLTGVTLNLYAPPEYLKAQMPHLAPSRLAYDPAKKELREKDGHAIDILIVGSGPAGSELAHE